MYPIDRAEKVGRAKNCKITKAKKKINPRTGKPKIVMKRADTL